MQLRIIEKEEQKEEEEGDAGAEEKLWTSSEDKNGTKIKTLKREAEGYRDYITTTTKKTRGRRR